MANPLHPSSPEERDEAWNEIERQDVGFWAGLAGRRQDKERIERLAEALRDLTDAGYEHVSGNDEADALAAAVQKAARVLSPNPEWYAAADETLAALADKEDTPNG